MQNTEIFYKAIDFYLAQQPMMLNDILAGVSQRIVADVNEGFGNLGFGDSSSILASALAIAA